MGVAAYNRGSQAISEHIALDYPLRDSAFAVMDRINAMAKKPLPELEILRGKRKPLLDKYAIQFDRAHNVWWMMNPESMYEGYAIPYPMLMDVITSWDDLYLTGYDYTTHIWTAEAY